MLPAEMKFPNLAHFECTDVSSEDELNWIQWHLRHYKRLKSFSISCARLSKSYITRPLFSFPGSLQELSLCSIDLSTVNVSIVWSSLRRLQLQYCTGMDSFLSEASRSQTSKLQSFRVVGEINIALLKHFLLRLSENTHLKELNLCMGEARHSICLRYVEPHARALKHIVFDFRGELRNAKSAIQYSATEFEEILARFPRLESLRIPLQLDDQSPGRYRRAEFKVCSFSPPALPNTDQNKTLHLQPMALKTLHIRRLCSPYQRFAGDAKHTAAPFQHNGEFTVFLGLGKRVKKIKFGTNSKLHHTIDATNANKEMLCMAFR